MKADRKGQGLSLTTIIVAVIALVVLVVLVMIFTGRIGIFEEKVGEVGEDELIALRWSYGDCQPGQAAEKSFLSNLKNAGEDETAKDSYRSDFKKLISDCKDKTETECVSPCVWS